MERLSNKITDRLTDTIWTPTSDTAELLGVLQHGLIGIGFATTIDTGMFFHGQNWWACAIAGMLVAVGIFKAVAWMWGNVRVRRGSAMIGILAWLFVAGLLSVSTHRDILVLACLLYAFNDMLAYLRLRFKYDTSRPSDS